MKTSEHRRAPGPRDGTTPLRPALTLAIALGVTAPLSADDWPMLGRDATRNPASLERNPPVEWDVETGKMDHAIHASPVFANGTLYLATQGFLYALANEPERSRHDWPQWRGPDRSNVSRETGLLNEWPAEGPPLLWTITGLGEGITAMAVADGTAYTLGYRDDTEFLFAIDAATGESRWVAPVGTVLHHRSGAFNALMRWLSPRVPTVDGDRIYTITAEGELTCLRTESGQVLWRKRYPNDFLSPLRAWGFCDYPLVDGDHLICVPGGAGATVVALNKHTGESIWTCPVPGGESGSYAATMISTAHGIRHYVVFLNNGLAGVDAQDGRLLWQYMRRSRYAATSYTPIVQDDFVLAANGYGWGLALLKLAPDGDGLAALEQYHQPYNFNPFQDNTVVVGDYVYAVHGPGRLVCLELQTGKVVWEQPAPEPPAESPAQPPSQPQVQPRPQPQRRVALTAADHHLYVRRSDGSMTRVEATPAGYVERGSFQIPEPEEVSGVTAPVIANGRLYLRDNRRLLCYDLGADALTPPRVAPRVFEVVWKRATNTALALRALPPPTGVPRAPDAIYVPTPEDVVAKMLELASLNRNDVVYDLGSGDGRIVLGAARRYGCRAVGYEINPQLVEQSRESVRAQDLGHLVRIEYADLFTVDLSGADVVAVYLPTPLLERLRPQFDQLKPGARIVSHQFAIPGVTSEPPTELISMEDGDRHRIFRYTLPLRPQTFGGSATGP